jgi:hypothetical protein
MSNISNSAKTIAAICIQTQFLAIATELNAEEGIVNEISELPINFWHFIADKVSGEVLAKVRDGLVSLENSGKFMNECVNFLAKEWVNDETTRLMTKLTYAMSEGSKSDENE